MWNWIQVKERRGELEILKSNFIHGASAYLRNYFADLVDTMLDDKNYFSQVFRFALPFTIKCCAKFI